MRKLACIFALSLGSALVAQTPQYLPRSGGKMTGTLVGQKITANSVIGNIPVSGSATNIILSDDMDTDPDGALEIEALLHWADIGAANILAMVADSPNPYAAPVMHILTSYSGYTIPIGAYQGGSEAGSSFTQATVAQFNPGDTRANYPACATTLRTALAAAANSSVVIVTTGFGTCLNELLTSSADGISPLTGSQLIESKVIRYVSVAGDYPQAVGGTCGGGEGQLEYNFCAYDPGDWNNIFTTWTTQNGFPPIVSVSFTSGINAGTFGLPSSFPSTNPAQYLVQQSGFVNRPPWGVLGIWYAVFGNVAGAFTLTGSGTNTVNGTTGANVWSSSPQAGQYYLINAKSAPFYQAYFDGQSYSGADWFMPYNVPGSIIFSPLECAPTYGCVNDLTIGNYTLSYGPTGNIEINRPGGFVVEDFEMNGVSKAAFGVDDGAGVFMIGTNSGDVGIRLDAASNRFFVTNLSGFPVAGVDQNGSFHSYVPGSGSLTGPQMSMDAGGASGGGRLLATGSTTSATNSVLIGAVSSDLSITHVLASMNAAGFVNVGSNVNNGYDQSGNDTMTSFNGNHAGAGTATFTAGAGAGSGATTPSCATGYVCDSVSGQVSFTTGTSPPTTGIILTVTLGGVTRASKPVCAVQGENESTGTSVPVIGIPQTTTTTLPIPLAGTALAASSVYNFNYQCFGK
jgi:hypothetical protein